VSFSNTIVEQANRMAGIIRQLLDFARRRSSQRAPVDMGELAEQVVDLIAATARKTNVSLEIEKPDGLPRANVDHSQIQQVLLNLVMNGIHAMPNGGKLVLALGVENTPDSHASDKRKQDWFCIRVTDEGVGIPEENVALVFDPFFTTKGVGKGTGLGLSIAHGIIEEHGGWIDVRSEVGKGTCFSIYLPLEES